MSKNRKIPYFHYNFDDFLVIWIMDNNYETQKTELCKHKEKLIKWFLWISASPTQKL